MDYELIVAGGGPAGLSAARAASEKGIDVLVLELKAQIGQSPISGWVCSDELEERFSQEVISEVTKVGINGVKNELEVEGQFGKILDRKLVERKLALEAVNAGVDIWVGTPVTGLLSSTQGVYGVESESGEWSEELESEMVVDATGAGAEWSSLFRRKIQNSEWNEERVNQTNEYMMANVSGGNKVDLYFSSFLAPIGHAWVYPERENFGVAGIRGVRIHPDSALDEFIGRVKPNRLRDSVPVGAYRSQLPVEGPLESTAADGILVVGSSAGQVYPLSGHGLRFALDAGEFAGRVSAEAIKEENTGERRLSEYDSLWRREFEREIESGKLLQEALVTSPDQKMDDLIDYLKEDTPLARDFVNIFAGNKISESMSNFFKDEECKRIFGEKTSEEILALNS